jgi:hypothetical protein
MIEFELKIGNEKNFDNGAFSVIIFEPEKRVATKVFYPFKGKSNDFIKNVFLSEVDAYKKIWEDKGKISQLQKITPIFHGVVEETIKITHDLNQDIDPAIPKELISDLSFKMEYVNIPFKKLSSCDSNFIKGLLHVNGFQQTSIYEVFRAYGLWAIDASIAIHDEKIWVIDFATEDFDNFK